MPRTVFIGADGFEAIRARNCFYVDKTDFIRQWWDSGAKVTAIMRPRRFGKTLAMDMARRFFSTEHAGRGDLFEGLSIWEEERFRALQGAYPVLFLSFAEVKEESFEEARDNICQLIQDVYEMSRFLLDEELLTENEKAQFKSVRVGMPKRAAAASLRSLMSYLSRYHGKKVIVLLDEYDTPLQEAYAKGYWKQLAEFLRPLFGATFKGNPYLERGLMTGITRVARESIFSDLNNLDVVTTTSEKYEDCFGFTQEEVDAALEEFGLSGQAEAVKAWYDGFTFGRRKDIYNPWSITNFLDKRKLDAYWANTSSNFLVSRLVREGSGEVKMDCERLLAGESIQKPIDEQIVFSQLGAGHSRLGSDSSQLGAGHSRLGSDSSQLGAGHSRLGSDHLQRGSDGMQIGSDDALWSFLLASGYLKVLDVEGVDSAGEDLPRYTLALTNGEVRRMFRAMVRGWFAGDGTSSAYGDFLKALLDGDVEGMNYYLNRVTESALSYFDVGGREPERFYHGFVLGLMVSLDRDYYLRSNRESGRGRYDVVLEPKDREKNDAIIFELKAREAKERDLEATVGRALEQIEEKGYDRELLARGFTEAQIRKYGFAFEGKSVLIGG